MLDTQEIFFFSKDIYDFAWENKQNLRKNPKDKDTGKSE